MEPPVIYTAGKEKARLGIHQGGLFVSVPGSLNPLQPTWASQESGSGCLVVLPYHTLRDESHAVRATYHQ